MINIFSKFFSLFSRRPGAASSAVTKLGSNVHSTLHSGTTQSGNFQSMLSLLSDQTSIANLVFGIMGGVTMLIIVGFIILLIIGSCGNLSPDQSLVLSRGIDALSTAFEIAIGGLFGSTVLGVVISDSTAKRESKSTRHIRKNLNKRT